TASMPLLPSALPPKGEASHYGANNFLNLIASLLQGGRSLRLFQYSVALLIFMRRPIPLNPLNLLNPLSLFRTQSKGDTPQGQLLNLEP
uniref:hypothetical protein n=1 Tax=Dialister sp. TaxID=1955814 RepID=UPI004024F0ED